jgi:hypothetical protein
MGRRCKLIAIVATTQMSKDKEKESSEEKARQGKARQVRAG